MKEKHFRIGRYFYLYRNKGFMWFRVFGYGLHFKNVALHGLTFSQRYNLHKRLQIGNWIIGTLKP